MANYRPLTSNELIGLRKYILRNNIKSANGMEPTIANLSKGEIQYYDVKGFRFANYFSSNVFCLKEIPADELQPN